MKEALEKILDTYMGEVEGVWFRHYGDSIADDTLAALIKVFDEKKRDREEKILQSVDAFTDNQGGSIYADMVNTFKHYIKQEIRDIFLIE